MTRPNKFGNRKTIVDGITFASAKEARRYGELKLLERAGELAELKLQPRYPLTVNGHLICTYVADFSFALPPVGNVVVEDVKGYRTDVYVMKRKLMQAVHNIDVVEV